MRRAVWALVVWSCCTLAARAGTLIITDAWCGPSGELLYEASYVCPVPNNPAGPLELSIQLTGSGAGPWYSVDPAQTLPAGYAAGTYFTGVTYTWAVDPGAFTTFRLGVRRDGSTWTYSPVLPIPDGVGESDLFTLTIDEASAGSFGSLVWGCVWHTGPSYSGDPLTLAIQYGGGTVGDTTWTTTSPESTVPATTGAGDYFGTTTYTESATPDQFGDMTGFRVGLLSQVNGAEYLVSDWVAFPPGVGEGEDPGHVLELFNVGASVDFTVLYEVAYTTEDGYSGPGLDLGVQFEDDEGQEGAWTDVVPPGAIEDGTAPGSYLGGVQREEDGETTPLEGQARVRVGLIERTTGILYAVSDWEGMPGDLTDPCANTLECAIESPSGSYVADPNTPLPLQLSITGDEPAELVGYRVTVEHENATVYAFEYEGPLDQMPTDIPGLPASGTYSVTVEVLCNWEVEEAHGIAETQLNVTAATITAGGTWPNTGMWEPTSCGNNWNPILGEPGGSLDFMKAPVLPVQSSYQSCDLDQQGNCEACNPATGEYVGLVDGRYTVLLMRRALQTGEFVEYARQEGMGWLWGPASATECTPEGRSSALSGDVVYDPVFTVNDDGEYRVDWLLEGYSGLVKSATDTGRIGVNWSGGPSVAEGTRWVGETTFFMVDCANEGSEGGGGGGAWDTGEIEDLIAAAEGTEDQAEAVGAKLDTSNEHLGNIEDAMGSLADSMEAMSDSIAELAQSFSGEGIEGELTGLREELRQNTVGEPVDQTIPDLSGTEALLGEFTPDVSFEETAPDPPAAIPFDLPVGQELQTVAIFLPYDPRSWDLQVPLLYGVDLARGFVRSLLVVVLGLRFVSAVLKAVRQY